MKWLPLGFPLEQGNVLTLASWVDNVYAVSSHPDYAIQMLVEFEADLSSSWGLLFGSDSKQVIVALGYPDSLLQDMCMHDFKWTSTFKCMGHLIDHDAGYSSCLKQTASAMWRAFHSNAGALELRGRLNAQIRTFHRTVTPVFTYRCTRWPWAKTAAKHVLQDAGGEKGPKSNCRRVLCKAPNDGC